LALSVERPGNDIGQCQPGRDSKFTNQRPRASRKLPSPPALVVRMRGCGHGRLAIGIVPVLQLKSPGFERSMVYGTERNRITEVEG
jgi:hypothetical protein